METNVVFKATIALSVFLVTASFQHNYLNETVIRYVPEQREKID
jgi:hypothetical protein